MVNRAEEEGAICPAKLRKNVFTVGAYDNIDHNPSSTTSKGSFHGTSISGLQMTTHQSPGEERIFETSVGNTDQRIRSVPELPEAFAKVKTAILPNQQPQPQVQAMAPKKFPFLFDMNKSYFHGEDAWLEHCRGLFSDGNNLHYSWAAFHASKVDLRHVSINSLLPLFSEDSGSVSMLTHGLNVLRDIT